jgi:hypothetical protein
MVNGGASEGRLHARIRSRAKEMKMIFRIH